LGFFQPFAPFVIMNVFGLVAPLISMSLRLFGNITSGSVLMLLFYTFTQWQTKLVLPFVDFNFIGIATAPFLHLYFDIFTGFIQTYIFISLTTIFIGIELPQE
jgi:F-type H+-transporting ATPase subunit a